MLKFVFVSTLVTLSLSSIPRSLPKISRSQADLAGRVFDGTKISAGDAPFIVRLEIKAPGVDEHFNCGGSILNEYWVITAAHCPGDYLKYNKGDVYTPTHGYHVKVIAGDVNKLVTEAAQQEVTVQQVFIHDKYDNVLILNDIALMLLSKPLKLSNDVAAISLGTTLPSAGSAITCVGWGTYDSKDVLSNDLLKIEYVVTPRKNCTDAYPDWDDWSLPDDQFCTGHWDMVKHHAPGDSGGPLYTKSGSTFTLYGIVSWGPEAEDYGEGQYDVNTDVSKHIDWIKNIQETYKTLMQELTAGMTAASVSWTAVAGTNYVYQSYTITGAGYIDVKITAFDFGPGNFDMLTLYDGDSPNSTIIMQLHYTKDWKSSKSYTSTGKAMFILIRTDFYDQKKKNSLSFKYKTVTMSEGYTSTCNSGWSLCSDKTQCFQSSARCDNNTDCFDMSDESKPCSGSVTSFDGLNMIFILLGVVCTYLQLYSY